MNLIVVLLIIVHLVIIKTGQLPIGGIDFPGRVVGAIIFKGSRIHTVPRLIGDFMPTKTQKFDERIFILIGRL